MKRWEELSDHGAEEPAEVFVGGAPGSTVPTPAPIDVGVGYRVSLPEFEGPLDLLLHLIQQHELDILDIPIAFIAEKYVEYIKLMNELNIDLASEYLVMAATLAHIKSKMLLPTLPADQDDALEEEGDPRAELIRRLLEYQKYRNAAEQLADRKLLGRDVFGRPIAGASGEGPAPLAPGEVFKLFSAFQRILERVKTTLDHEIEFERFSIADRINQLVDLLRGKRQIPFESLFDDQRSKPDLIVTFLAILEMAKLRLLRIFQTQPLDPIFVELADEDTGDTAEVGMGEAESAAELEHPVVVHGEETDLAVGLAAEAPEPGAEQAATSVAAEHGDEEAEAEPVEAEMAVQDDAAVAPTPAAEQGDAGGEAEAEPVEAEMAVQDDAAVAPTTPAAEQIEAEAEPAEDEGAPPHDRAAESSAVAPGSCGQSGSAPWVDAALAGALDEAASERQRGTAPRRAGSDQISEDVLPLPTPEGSPDAGVPPLGEGAVESATVPEDPPNDGHSRAPIESTESER